MVDTSTAAVSMCTEALLLFVCNSLKYLHLMSKVALQWLHKSIATLNAMFLWALPGSWLPAGQS